MAAQSRAFPRERPLPFRGWSVETWRHRSDSAAKHWVRGNSAQTWRGRRCGIGAECWVTLALKFPWNRQCVRSTRRV